MKQGSLQKICGSSVRINRYAYALFIVLSIILFARGDYQWAFVNMGMALVFDPFDPNVSWADRPLYQRAWLFIHLLVVLGLLLFMLLQHHPL